MPRPKRWDLTKCGLSVNGQPIVGFSDGDYFTASYDTNRHTKHMSPDGYGRHVKNPCTDGHATIVLSSQSPAINTIALLVKADEPLAINCSDFTAAGAGFFSDDCLIEKIPDFVRGKEPKDVEWVFIFTRGTINHAGATLEDV